MVQEPHTQPVAHRTCSARAQEPTSDPTTGAPTSPTQPVAQRTRSRYSLAANLLAALPVLDEESGKLLEHRQLRRHPRLKETWDTSYANELGRLCQGIGKGTAGPAQQRVKGTSTFRVICYDDIPSNKMSDIFHTRVVCEYFPDKDDPNRTRITLAGGHICVPYDVSTPTGSVELVKMMIKSVLSRQNAKFAAFDVKNFYLDTPMGNPEYVRVQLKDIP